MWCGARVIRGRMGMAGRRSSIISGCFRCARTCAGAMRSTSRSCRHCGGRTCQCGGPISPSGTPAIPTRRCESGSSSAIARSSKAELAERPADPFVLFNLGAVAVERQDWRTALGYLQRSLRGSGSERFDRAQAVRPDRPLPPDARRPAGRPGRLRRGPAARPGRRRDSFPQGCCSKAASRPRPKLAGGGS